MTQYSYTETYSGFDILVKVTTDTGSRLGASGTIQTHTIRAYIDDVLQYTLEASDDELAAKITESIAGLKQQIDDKNDTDLILEGLGFTEDPAVDQVATPTGFDAAQIGGPGGEVLLSWDVVGPVEIYEIQQASASDFSDAFTISTGDTTPYSIGVIPPGTYYFRIRAKIAGMADSDWATDTITVI